MKERIHWIDIAKGIAIMLVVIGHVPDAFDAPFYRVAIYTFHMPLFFFLSGYVFSEKENFSVFLKSKCKSIL